MRVDAWESEQWRSKYWSRERSREWKSEQVRGKCKVTNRLVNKRVRDCQSCQKCQNTSSEVRSIVQAMTDTCMDGRPKIEEVRQESRHKRLASVTHLHSREFPQVIQQLLTWTTSMILKRLVSE